MKVKELWGKTTSSISNIVKTELNFKHSDFGKIVLKCLSLSVLLFLSLITEYAVYATVLLAGIFICTEKSARRTYYMFFLLPFLNILRYTTFMEKTFFGSSFYLSIFLWCIVLAILGVQLFLDFIAKRKQVNWFFTIMCGVLAVYFALPFGPFNFTNFGAIYVTLAIVFVLYYYAKEFDFKEIIFLFFIAVMLGAIFGFFRPLFTRAENIVPYFDDIVQRFSGVSNDPNYFAGDILMVLAGLSILFVSKKINYVFYPSVFVLSLFGIMSASKMFFLTYAIFMVCLVLYIMAKNWFKTGFYKSLAIFCAFLLAGGFAFPWISGTFNRIEAAESTIVDEGYVTVPSEFEGDKAPSIQEGTEGEYVETVYVFRNNFLTGLTTGRTNIWLGYLDKSFDSVVHALFGHGVGAPFLLVDNGANVRYRAEHNTFVQMIYRIGIVGILLVGLTVFAAIDRKKFKSIKLYNWANAIVVFMLYMSLCNMLSYRTSMYITILALSLCFREHNEDQVVTEDKKEPSKSTKQKSEKVNEAV